MLYYDPNSYATNPGGVSLSRKKFKEVIKYLPLLTRMFVDDNTFEKGDQWLRMGATNPAIVKSVDPNAFISIENVHEVYGTRYKK